MRCIPYRTLSNKIDGVVLTFVDITDRKRAELELKSFNQALEERVSERIGALRLVQAITRAANEAMTVEEALQPALQQTCNYMRWPLGHAYLVEDSGKNLVSSGLWCADQNGKFEAFRKATEGHRFAIGEGSPGRVLAGGKSLWIPDMRSDPSIVRAQAANESGIRATLLIPVLTQKEVVAVLEFFSAEVREPNSALLEVTEQIGIQIGRVFERKRAERRLRENERLAALGTSTAKIAHEINNPLGNIYAAVQFLERDLSQKTEPSNDAVLELVTDVKNEIDRLKELMGDLRSFATTGRQTMKLDPVDMGALVGEVLKLEEPVLNERKVRLMREISLDLGQVSGDKNKLKEVLGNLIRNSLEAMPDGGALTVRACRMGDQVCLEIIDTGVGISGNVNVLEQPVTTKKQGVGLGLLIVRQIVLDHGGTIAYSSEPGHGTTFRIMLPLKT